MDAVLNTLHEHCKPGTAVTAVQKQLSGDWRLSENCIFVSFQIERNMIVATVFLSILIQIEFQLVKSRKENCRHDHIPFNVKGNGNIVFLSARNDVIRIIYRHMGMGANYLK